MNIRAPKDFWSGIMFLAFAAVALMAALRARGLEVRVDARNEKINAKVREHSLARVPVLAVVGRREAEQRTVALRRLGGDAQEIMSLDQAVGRLAREAMPPDLITEAASM